MTSSCCLYSTLNSISFRFSSQMFPILSILTRKESPACVCTPHTHIDWSHEEEGEICSPHIIISCPPVLHKEPLCILSFVHSLPLLSFSSFFLIVCSQDQKEGRKRDSSFSLFGGKWNENFSYILFSTVCVIPLWSVCSSLRQAEGIQQPLVSSSRNRNHDDDAATWSLLIDTANWTTENMDIAGTWRGVEGLLRKKKRKLMQEMRREMRDASR